MPKHYGPKSIGGVGSREDVDLSLKSAEKAAFVDWLSLPPSEREPSSIPKFGQAVGVSRKTLYNWRRDPRVIAAVKGKITGAIAIRDLPQIVDTLKEIAFDPQNPRAVQAAKELIALMERGEKATDSIPLADLTDAEMRELASNFYDEMDKRIDDDQATA